MGTGAFRSYTGSRDELGSAGNGFCIIRLVSDESGKPCDWVFLYANEALAKLEGRTVDELVGGRYFELFPDRNRERIRPHIEAAYNGKCVSFYDMSAEVESCLRIDVYPTGERGCCACVLNSLQGVLAESSHERENLGEVIRRLEEDMRLDSRVKELTTAMGMVYPLAISIDYLRDTYQMIEYDNFLNKTAERSGKIDELIRVGASTVPDAEAAEEFWRLFNRQATIDAFRSGKKQVFLRHPQNGDDGRVHHMYTQAICTELSDTEIKGISISRCIDDEMELAQAVSDASGRLETIDTVASLYSTVMGIDLVSREYRLIKGVPLMENALDGRRSGLFDDIIDTMLDKLVNPDSHGEMREFFNLDTLPERLEHVDSVTREYTDDIGRWFKARFVAQRRDEHGRAVYALYIARDITQEKQTEIGYLQQLKATAAEAERANISKTNFLRRMSHDIRTPLNGIIGMLKIMDENEGDRKKYREYMDKILRSADYLLSIVNNVLDIGKMESGEIELEHRPFDLNQLLLNTVPIIATNASQNSIVLENGRADIEMTHTHVVGSPTHINRVLMNIASNAIKYNRAGGTIRLSCRELRCDGDQASYEIICEDTGLGMSEEFQKKAFESYTREGKPTTTGFSGSGLGLSIVKKIVDKMGGTIQLSSRENVGTRVRIVLDLALDKNPEQSAESSRVPEKLDLTGRRCMLVEDNEINMEIATIILKGFGLNVTCVVNGREAVDTFQKSPPYTFDFIFMDMMMPVMDGLEATRTIRALPKPDAGTVQIIAMTANAFAEDRKACLDAGMNDHIGKPIDNASLAALLWKLVK